MVYDISSRLTNFNLNTVVSGFMEYTNTLTNYAKENGGVDKATLETLSILLAPFAPHIAEELYSKFGHETSVFDAGWPTYDEKAMEDDEIEVVVQVNGKMKGKISVAKDIAQADAIATAKEMLGDKLTGNIVKEIYVPGRIVNIVAK